MTTTNDNPGFLTVDDIAEHLRVSVRTVRRWIRERSLPVHRFGGSVRIDRDDLARFIKVHRDA